MTPFHHYGVLAVALKIATGVFSIVAALMIIMDPTVKVAIIAAIPPTISSLMWGYINHKKLQTVEVNTNHRLDKLLQERNTATTRADTAEAHALGRTEGVAAQRPEKEK